MKTPPLLLGLTLLFWGWQSGLLIMAVPLAALLEAARFIARRFDLAAKDFNRISDFCAVFFSVLAVYSYAAGSGPLARWVPLAVWPLVAAQAWSTVQGVDTGAIFWTARQKLKKTGQTHGRQVDLSYPYFIVVMVAASAANVRDIWFYTALLILGGYALWPQRPRRYSPLLWFMLLALVGGFGFAGQAGLHALHEKVDRSVEDWLMDWMTPDRDPFQNITALGDIGQLKLSGKILFRVSQDKGAGRVKLLREAAYNGYHSTRWFVYSRSWQGWASDPGGEDWTLGPGSDPAANLRIETYLNKGQGLLKLPLGAFEVDHLPVGKLSLNRMGAVRAEQGPGLVSYGVRYGQDSPRDAPPGEQDLLVPREESPALEEVVRKLALAGLSPREKARRLRDYLKGRFQYSLNLTKTPPGTTALSDFLLRTRAGHCEYFATALALLLRTCGVPARYATGYLVDEYSRLEGQYVVRARHAHAWTLAWLDGRWVELDATPASWVALESQSSPAWQPLEDAWLWLTFKISRWRWSEARDSRARHLPWLLLPLALYLLWRIRGRRAALDNAAQGGPTLAGRPLPGADSPFYLVENRLTASGYSRPPHQPLSLWLETLNRSGLPATDVTALKTMLGLHHQLRFNPQADVRTVTADLAVKVQSWLAAHPPEN